MRPRRALLRRGGAAPPLSRGDGQEPAGAGTRAAAGGPEPARSDALGRSGRVVAGCDGRGRDAAARLDRIDDPGFRIVRHRSQPGGRCRLEDVRPTHGRSVDSDDPCQGAEGDPVGIGGIRSSGPGLARACAPGGCWTSQERGAGGRPEERRSTDQPGRQLDRAGLSLWQGLRLDQDRGAPAAAPCHAPLRHTARVHTTSRNRRSIVSGSTRRPCGSCSFSARTIPNQSRTMEIVAYLRGERAEPRCPLGIGGVGRPGAVSRPSSSAPTGRSSTARKARSPRRASRNSSGSSRPRTPPSSGRILEGMHREVRRHALRPIRRDGHWRSIRADAGAPRGRGSCPDRSSGPRTRRAMAGRWKSAAINLIVKGPRRGGGAGRTSCWIMPARPSRCCVRMTRSTLQEPDIEEPGSSPAQGQQDRRGEGPGRGQGTGGSHRRARPACRTGSHSHQAGRDRSPAATTSPGRGTSPRPASKPGPRAS